VKSVLTPLDIQKKEFNRKFRGYSEEEVDIFMDQITQDFEKLFRENQDLKEELEQVNKNISRYQEIEEVLKNTMILAQKSAEDVRQNTEKEAGLLKDQARIEADRITRESEQEAAAIIQEAERHAADLIAGAERKVSVILEENHRLENQARVFKMRFRSFLETQLKILEGENDGDTSFEEEE
jgi:cell division initiation protein